MCALSGPSPGYVADDGDCDDGDASTYPGASEIHDDLDNQCPGEPGHGLVDEISGDSGFHDPVKWDELSWDPQVGATSYEVARAGAPDFSVGCITFATVDTYWNDSSVPAAPGVYYYLVRAAAPGIGSWGSDSAGTERANICP